MRSCGDETLDGRTLLALVVSLKKRSFLKESAGDTHPSRQRADGQLREWYEYLHVGGNAGNVCICRCQLLQRDSLNKHASVYSESERR